MALQIFGIETLPENNMTDLGFPLEDIAKLISIVEKRGLAEIVFEEGDRRICVRGANYFPNPTARSATVSVPATDERAVARLIESRELDQAPPASETAPILDNRVPLCSPMVGVFYRTPSPDIPSYVEVGDHVVVGQTIGIIEAMKVFSEIPAEVAGIVAEIVAVNGVLVKPNEPIMYIVAD